jgi:methylated-DNA-protein-cysteine methyltransferase-like protein
MEKESIYTKIYEVVKKIPKGKVATYGQIAKTAGIQDVRMVGWAIHKNDDPAKLPCHRVVKMDGSLAKGYSMGGTIVQRKMLEAEGVKFLGDKVDLVQHKFEL